MAKKMTLAEWMEKVNIALVKRCGMGVDDLPDYCYFSAYEAGDSPSECAKDVIEAAHNY